jgi:hypothetical protein
VSKPLATTLTTALAIDTLGGIDTANGRYLPAPSRYVATWTLWFVLGLAAGVGPNAARAAWQLSALVLIAKLVVGGNGGAGRKVVGFLNQVGNFFPADTGGPQ